MASEASCGVRTCKRGHALVSGNLYVYHGRRACRTCSIARAGEMKRAKRLAKRNNCIRCGANISTMRSDAKFCSRPCFSLHQYWSDPEKRKRSANKWYHDNIERARKTRDDWSAANVGKVRELVLRNRRARRKAAPKWLTREHKDQMAAVYSIAANSGMHVDHIVPINGSNVCGLHVPWNLQILPAIENMRKGNKHAA